MTSFRKRPLLFRKQRGFTLLEIIIVIALIGLILASVRFTVFTSTAEKDIEKQVQRLQVVFNMASDFAVINQLELGLRINEQKQSYEFVMLDENEQWLPLEEQKHFAQVILPEDVLLELNLEGLPWQNDESLFDNRIFDEQLSVSTEGVEIGSEEDRVPPPPQIFIFSSGEITPFELLFKYQPKDYSEKSFEFSLQGQDTVPLKRKGPA